MYEQVDKPKENNSRANTYSVAQKKNCVAQGFAFEKTQVPTVIQKKVTKFESKSVEVESPVEQYLNKVDTSKFGKNPDGDDVATSLRKILPNTPKYIKRVESVSANVAPNGPSEYARNAHYSQMVGHAGVQEAALTTGSAGYYQGGHLISHSLLGKGSVQSTAEKIDGYDNLVPMEAAMNNRTYKQLETEIANGTGVKAVEIDVTHNLVSFVSDQNVSKITKCPLKKPATASGTEITGVNAKSVKVTVGGGSIGKAEEIDRLAPHGRMMKSGKDVLEHLEMIGAMPWVSQALIVKLKTI
ncbi:hypothetical protein HG263_08400 [Pseudoalteromonas sp. JBTF-M23]|uniref:Type VII secretion system protein EssD-like domain-containing protein n=1 Tax=Pseudoalteromonas caenipelagi TaxID=2726988 RepID=A0A849VCN6_9GAMM|nr:DNA/RNA non-specific endonuclease [Pseudoalteromonas caenipelagi]NOU50560.1 hypothetical protein [Pseudoalteromonas caenipelagi]